LRRADPGAELALRLHTFAAVSAKQILINIRGCCAPATISRCAGRNQCKAQWPVQGNPLFLWGHKHWLFST